MKLHKKSTKHFIVSLEDISRYLFSYNSDIFFSKVKEDESQYQGTRFSLSVNANTTKDNVTL